MSQERKQGISGAVMPMRRGKRAGTLRLDKFAVPPILACIFSVIANPMILSTCGLYDSACLAGLPPVAKVFWPLLFVATLAIALPDRARLAVPANMKCLFAYLGFAGASVLWAFKPELSFIRYAQQVMVVTCVVLPILLADTRVDFVRILFLCFATATIINAVYAFGPPPTFAKNATPGYAGYFHGKNYLGLLSGVSIMLALNETLYPGRRRVCGVLVGAIAATLLYLSNSKTGLGLAIVAPILAWATVVAARSMRLSPAWIPIAVVLGFLVISTLFGISIYRVSYALYNDSTFTGRRWIWEFAQYEISRRPLLGWGYQSFWLVGPDAPSVVEAPGWIKGMPNAHNGYLDTIVELGYVGFLLLLAFLIATLHACRAVAVRDLRRGWVALSLMFFIMMSNGLESMWMRAFEFLWIVFIVIAAEVGRYSVSQRSAMRIWTSRSEPDIGRGQHVAW